jgi:hypothetical protein
VLQHQSEGIVERSKGRFVTYTEKYNHAFRVTIDQLEQQYQRAEVDWDTSESGLRVKTTNVARLTLRGERPIGRFVVDGQSFPMAPSVSFEKVDGKWAVAKNSSGLRKQNNLQGPIDDAFMEPFLCVRPPDGINDYAATVFERFEREFAKWMRGQLVAASSLRPGDSRAYNIVLFGTPATNPMVARAVKATPLQWTLDQIVVGALRFDGNTHLLSFIYPNPDYPSRYVVVNSGHTFHEVDFKGTNALLYPRAGDWAVTDVRTGAIVAEGIFDKNWQLPKR